jgi:hypothetical protein
MDQSFRSFVRGFFAGVFALGALVSVVMLVTSAPASIRSIAAVNLPVAVALMVALYRREVRTSKRSAA